MDGISNIFKGKVMGSEHIHTSEENAQELNIVKKIKAIEQGHIKSMSDNHKMKMFGLTEKMKNFSNVKPSNTFQHSTDKLRSMGIIASPEVRMSNAQMKSFRNQEKLQSMNARTKLENLGIFPKAQNVKHVQFSELVPRAVPVAKGVQDVRNNAFNQELQSWNTIRPNRAQSKTVNNKAMSPVMQRLLSRPQAGAVFNQELESWKTIGQRRNLKPFEDADKDGVPNWLDCKPLDRKKQGFADENTNPAEESLIDIEYKKRFPESDMNADMNKFVEAQKNIPVGMSYDEMQAQAQASQAEEQARTQRQQEAQAILGLEPVGENILGLELIPEDKDANRTAWEGVKESRIATKVAQPLYQKAKTRYEEYKTNVAAQKALEAPIREAAQKAALAKKYEQKYEKVYAKQYGRTVGVPKNYSQRGPVIGRDKFNNPVYGKPRKQPMIMGYDAYGRPMYQGGYRSGVGEFNAAFTQASRDISVGYDAAVNPLAKQRIRELTGLGGSPTTIQGILNMDKSRIPLYIKVDEWSGKGEKAQRYYANAPAIQKASAPPPPPPVPQPVQGQSTYYPSLAPPISQAGQGLVYSERSRRPVTYTRAPYTKHTQY
jgi:hypothetical protein